MIDDDVVRDEIQRLADQIDQLEHLNPAAHARVIRFLQRLATEPDISDADLSLAIRELFGDPPGLVH